MTFAKYINNDEKQLDCIGKKGTKIFLTEFKLVLIIEWILIFLHIFLLAFTIISLLTVIAVIAIEDEMHVPETVFESFTLVFLILLFLFLFLKRKIEYYLIRKNLTPIWGPNKFDKTIVKPEEIVYDQKHLWGNIQKSLTQHFEEETFIGWKNNSPFHKVLVISSKTPNGNVFSAGINEIYINREKKQVILSAAFYDPEIKGNRDFIFLFDIEKNIVSWSGILPYNPSYGKWILDR